MKDPSIQCFPKKIIDVVGSIDEVYEHCLIFSAYDNSSEDWNTNIEAGRELLDGMLLSFRLLRQQTIKYLPQPISRVLTRSPKI